MTALTSSQICFRLARMHDAPKPPRKVAPVREAAPKDPAELAEFDREYRRAHRVLTVAISAGVGLPMLLAVLCGAGCITGTVFMLLMYLTHAACIVAVLMFVLPRSFCPHCGKHLMFGHGKVRLKLLWDCPECGQPLYPRPPRLGQQPNVPYGYRKQGEL